MRRRKEDGYWTGEGPVMLIEDGLFDNTFKYSNRPPETFYCSKCHGTAFRVGYRDYATVLICCQCDDYEVMVHDG